MIYECCGLVYGLLQKLLDHHIVFLYKWIYIYILNVYNTQEEWDIITSILIIGILFQVSKKSKIDLFS